jgi:hypothetical protein
MRRLLEGFASTTLPLYPEKQRPLQASRSLGTTSPSSSSASAEHHIANPNNHGLTRAEEPQMPHPGRLGGALLNPLNAPPPVLAYQAKERSPAPR